jgi:hypothetical protein
MTGFGYGTKKGKVLVGGAATKIIFWDDSSITYEIKKALPVGPHNVVVQRKQPKGVSPLTYENAFTMVAPEILSIGPVSGVPGTPITINGNYIGTKKGKVYLADPVSGKKKTCKVTNWQMEPTNGQSTITFEVPKLPNGFTYGEAYPLKITTKAKETAETTFTALEPEP